MKSRFPQYVGSQEQEHEKWGGGEMMMKVSTENSFDVYHLFQGSDTYPV